MILISKKLFIFSTSICIIFNIILLCIYIEKRSLLEISYRQIIFCNSKYDLLLNSVKQNIVLKYSIEGSIPENVEDSIPKSKLYFRLNNRSCSACIENVSNLLRSNPLYLKKNNIVVIGNFINDKEKRFYEKEYFPFIIGLNTKKNVNNLDKAEVSYFFTIDTINRMRNVFIPNKNFPDLTITYLKTILKFE